MNNNIPTPSGKTGLVLSTNAWTILAVGFGFVWVLRTGYELGVSQARKIVKRSDKYVKKIEKREKQYLKEQRRKEKEKGP